VTSTKVRDARSAVGKDIGDGTYSVVPHPPHFKTEFADVTTVENGEESDAATATARPLPIAIDRGVAL
jgi:hypothetical protein